MVDSRPLVPFSIGRNRIRDVVLEPESGGRVYEVWEDGSTADWGRIIDWDPPARFSMTWNATGTPTVVELEFRTLGSARTEVLLEHRGWEALSERELGEDCALPGGYLGGSFSAEHGIGRLKTDMMEDWRGGAELEVMQRIKAAIDPRGLMNPGKVLP